jgi:hypothetical protein
MLKLELGIGLVIGLSLSTVWGAPTWQNVYNGNQSIAESGQTSNSLLQGAMVNCENTLPGASTVFQQ